MNQTRKTVVIIIITIAIAGGGFYYWQSSKNLFQAPTSELPIGGETTDWKTHRSMGVSISYPNDGTYTVDQLGMDLAVEGFTITQDHPSHKIYVYKMTSDQNLVSQDNFSIKVINDKSFREFFQGGLGGGYGYVIKLDGQFYIFESDWGPENQFNFNEVFELMMTTVKFE